MRNAKVSQDKRNDLPNGSQAGEWFVAREMGTWTVKRMITLADGTRTARRDKRPNYAKYADDYSPAEIRDQAEKPGQDSKPPQKLRDYVTRLNGKDPRVEAQKANAHYKLAWLNDEFLQAYREDELYSSISDRVNADALFAYLNRYALYWFVVLKKLNKPSQWKDHEKEWGRYLMNQPIDQKELRDDLRVFRNADKDDKLRTPQTKQLSAKVLRYTVFEMNRFIRYVYKKRRSEFREELIHIEPWSDKLLDTYEGNWRLKQPPRPVKYIKHDHWNIIV